jgi:hypothetical protein
MYFAELRSNFFLHPSEQNEKVSPRYWLCPAAFAGSTCIPHTGSFTTFADVSEQQLIVSSWRSIVADA